MATRARTQDQMTAAFNTTERRMTQQRRAILDLAHDRPVSRKTIRAELGFEVHDVRLEYRGLCASSRVAASD
jgi:Fe2+ or Zn2+ uptake regulation protein